MCDGGMEARLLQTRRGGEDQPVSVRGCLLDDLERIALHAVRVGCCLEPVFKNTLHVDAAQLMAQHPAGAPGLPVIQEGGLQNG